MVLLKALTSHFFYNTRTSLPDMTATQDTFAQEQNKLEDPASVGVLLCGQKEMCQSVTEMLKGQGVQQIMLNF